MRSLLSLGALLMALTLFAPAIGAAQEATPASGFTDLGLPTLDITVTADAYEGIPASLPAGRYLVTVSVAAENGDLGGGVGFVQPAGMSGEEFIGFLGQLAGSPDEGGADAAATPVDGGVASPAADGGDESLMLPPVIYQSRFAGGVYAASGGSAQIVLDLPPGAWVAWGDDPTAPWAPVAFEVTGEMPADLPEPSSSATLTMFEYDIQVSEGAIAAGPQVVRIDNVGAQPHFITASTVAADITEDDMKALLDEDITGTPAAVGFDPDTDFQESFFSGTQSMGTSVWLPIEAQPGNLVLLCFFPDLADGLPHAYHGMYSIVEVGT